MQYTELTLFTSQPSETEELAEHLGTLLHGGECIELVADMGGGKTTFVRGLARGIGSFDSVGSPTFTLAKQYNGTKVKVYHYDFYRVEDAGLVAEELAEGLEDPHGVSVVEWADSVQSVLPQERIIVRIMKNKEDPQARQISVVIPPSYAHMQGMNL
jgi:tRNA threonylcarbamoyladenosine biosynthesis protein TsaE